MDAPIEDDGGALRRADPTTTHGFAVMVRNEAFRWARLAARRDHEALAEAPHDDGSPWRPSQLAAALAPYWEEHDEVLLDADARSSAYLDVERRADDWVVTQILRDPLDTKEWRIVGRVDLAASARGQRSGPHPLRDRAPLIGDARVRRRERRRRRRGGGTPGRRRPCPRPCGS